MYNHNGKGKKGANIHFVCRFLLCFFAVVLKIILVGCGRVQLLHFVKLNCIYMRVAEPKPVHLLKNLFFT